MVRVARERVADLFALAESEAAGGHADLADRYVALARRIGMRYNVRLLSEYRELYCRTCSAFWIEGRTVRTRLRGGRRVRTCLKCGRERRTPVKLPRAGSLSPEWGSGPPVRRAEGALVGPADEGEPDEAPDEDPEEP
jgi:ribonuclease P protein subunit RPR2